MEDSKLPEPPVKVAQASLDRTQLSPSDNKAPLPASSTSISQEQAAVTEGTAALEAAHLPADLPQELEYELVMAWRGEKRVVKIKEMDTVGDLKQLLWSLTTVPPERQKIVGLVRGKLPGDEEEVVKLGLGDTSLKKKEFMMIGTPEGEESKAVGPSAQDEGDLDYGQAEAQKKAYLAVQSVRNRRKLKEHAEKLQVDVMAPPRPGKKLLVCDLDYCIMDTRGWQEPAFSTQLFMRPYLHDMLKAISPWYDVIFWSQTHWRWLEQKLIELDIIGPSKKGDYHIVTTLDRSPMFSVYSEKDGKPWKHEVKALGIIWAKFPEYTAESTIHIDDLGRNFAMNVKNGLRVHAYKDALTRGNDQTDREMLYVAKYLLQLVNIADVTQLDHSRFRKCKLPLPEGVNDPLDLVKRHNAPDPPAAPEPEQKRS
ncbi:hypothetical protein JCM11641_005585 [Rhodosporidiobolus odoratus]